jgi:hypothetical protein
MNNERAPRVAGGLTMPAQLAGIALGALAIAAAGFIAVSPSHTALSAECPAQFTLDFNDVPAGTILSEQYANFGVHISAVANGNHPDALIVFDTNAPPTHDPDLAVDIGNIAVLAENVRDQNGDGLVDDPDENNFGGKVTFTFDQDVSIGSFVFVDHDHQPADFAAAYDASGNLITKVTIPIAGNGSVQTVNVNADGVRRFELVYRDSAGFTGIEVECQQPGGTPTATPAGGGATPTATPRGGAATPTATPVGGGGATPTATPAGAGAGTATPVAGGQATPTPVVAGQTTSPSGGQQAVAVAGVSQPPAAQPQPAAVPSGGGAPAVGGVELSWLALTLLVAGLALTTGGALAAVRDIRRKDYY